MVNLTRIYTRTGDDGTTALGDMSRVSKNDPRLQAYADTDEANSSIGVAIALGGLDDGVVALLTRIQNDLFDVGADLCTPVVEDPEFPPLRVEQALRRPARGRLRRVQRRARAAALVRPPRRHAGSALLHVSRTVVRRAERSTWAALEAHGETMNPLTATYLNRLSDLLFILARHANLARRRRRAVEAGATPLTSARHRRVPQAGSPPAARPRADGMTQGTAGGRRDQRRRLSGAGVSR